VRLGPWLKTMQTWEPDIRPRALVEVNAAEQIAFQSVELKLIRTADSVLLGNSFVGLFAL